MNIFRKIWEYFAKIPPSSSETQRFMQEELLAISYRRQSEDDGISLDNFCKLYSCTRQEIINGWVRTYNSNPPFYDDNDFIGE